MCQNILNLGFRMMPHYKWGTSFHKLFPIPLNLKRPLNPQQNICTFRNLLYTSIHFWSIFQIQLRIIKTSIHIKSFKKCMYSCFFFILSKILKAYDFWLSVCMYVFLFAIRLCVYISIFTKLKYVIKDHCRMIHFDDCCYVQFFISMHAHFWKQYNIWAVLHDVHSNYI